MGSFFDDLLYYGKPLFKFLHGDFSPFFSSTSMDYLSRPSEPGVLKSALHLIDQKSRVDQTKYLLVGSLPLDPSWDKITIRHDTPCILFIDVLDEYRSNVHMHHCFCAGVRTRIAHSLMTTSRASSSASPPFDLPRIIPLFVLPTKQKTHLSL